MVKVQSSEVTSVAEVKFSPSEILIFTIYVYAGPGASLGYVYDVRGSRNDNKAELMTAVALQLGLEYCIWEHLALSADLRPLIGFHFGSGRFYRSGMYGFIPSLAVRYRF